MERVGVEATHRGLLRDENVFKLIQKWLGVDVKISSKHRKTSKVADVAPIHDVRV